MELLYNRLTVSYCWVGLPSPLCVHSSCQYQADGPGCLTSSHPAWERVLLPALRCRLPALEQKTKIPIERWLFLQQQNMWWTDVKSSNVRMNVHFAKKHSFFGRDAFDFFNFFFSLQMEWQNPLTIERNHAGNFIISLFFHLPLIKDLIYKF